MNENPFDKFDKPSEYHAGREPECAHLARLEQRIEAYSAPNNANRKSYWVWGILVALIIALAAFLYFNSASSDVDTRPIAKAYFTKYPNYVKEQQRGKHDGKSVDIAFDAYDRNDFSLSISHFDKQKNTLSELDKLYWAISLQGDQKWQESLSILSGITLQDVPVHREALDWYRALGYLGSGEITGATELLHKIKNSSSFYSEQAGKVLAELK